MDCCYLEPFIERLRNGEEVRMAVPCYDVKKREFFYDLRRFCPSPEADYIQAISIIDSILKSKSL